MNNEKELKMLSYLRKNGRERLTKISRQTKMPVSTLFDMLQKTNKIVKNTCLLDFSKLGFSIRANVILKVKPTQRTQLKEFLINYVNLNSLYQINNGYDFMVEVVCQELDELETFLEKIEDDFDIVEKNVYYIIKDIAREQFLSNPNSLLFLN